MRALDDKYKRIFNWNPSEENLNNGTEQIFKDILQTNSI